MLVRSHLQVEQLQIPIRGLPERRRGLKIVQLSDFHYDGQLLSEDLLDQAIDLSNQANADLIVLTGDFVSAQPDPIRALAQKLTQLRSRYGSFAVLGNHDLIYPHARRDITQALTQIDVTVLWNQVVYPCGADFALVGLPDFWAKDFDPGSVLAAIDAQIPRLVLSHNPDSAAVLKSWRVDLQLSGHTHGGQIIIPGIGNLSAIAARQFDNLPPFIQAAFPIFRACQRVVKNWDWAAGYHQVGSNQLYVNRGLGTYPPGRLFCPPEVTVITLMPDHSPQKSPCDVLT
ncbi:metallophosphoesterase [Romeriopsis navalis]|nr:metallophosphoesterase [Romeriopsis navalis]